MRISVGNIVFGGTGKTPFTIKLAEHYLNQQKQVAILSRGYKGKIGLDCNIISDGQKIYLEPPLAADEPHMMALRLIENQQRSGAMLITGKDRNQSHKIAKDLINPDLYILDDGFQHRRYQRDLDILLMDYQNPVSTGIFLMSRLREPLSAISRADIIIFTNCGTPDSDGSYAVPPKVKDLCGEKPVFFARHQFDSFTNGVQSFDIKELQHKRVAAFSGIANNGRFVSTLESVGISLAGFAGFSDHVDYHGKVLDRVYSLSKSADMMITTEKDYYKLPKVLREKTVYAKIDMAIDFYDKLIENIDTRWIKPK